MTDFFETITACDPPPVPLALIARAHAHLPACNLNILALDLGTITGWAVATRAGKQRSGSLELKPTKLGGNGRRWIAFREWLTATAREVGGIQAVYHEDVKNHAGVIAAHVYGGYLAMLEAWCAANNIPLVGVGVGTVKKHFTGNGRASKDDMIAEAKRRGVKVIDDNHADALAILGYAVEQEG
ncbi:hypothetical protein [Cupriavidus pinatubonensis]|uniref:hypothetical protein n=1 Tax=Cupriavidus pinatubonensis TaxID=248026 RepID=UPI003612EE7D